MACVCVCPARSPPGGRSDRARPGREEVRLVASVAWAASLVSTIQVSLLPPPWDELTTREPGRRATRVRPPRVT